MLSSARFSQPDVIFSVFWCGTSGQLRPPDTQIGMFFNWCQAVDCSSVLDTKALMTEQSTFHLKMGFDGCGVTNGFWGTIFAAGLDDQCDQVVFRVNQLLEHNRKVRLNLLGLSRGGMACLLLIKKLSSIPRSVLEVNAVIFDPVPGNGLTTSAIDVFGITIATQCLDVSTSQTLHKVLALYPFMPLPDIAFHAPILPRSFNSILFYLISFHLSQVSKSQSRRAGRNPRLPSGRPVV